MRDEAFVTVTAAIAFGLALVSSAAAATAPGAVGLASGWCGLAAYHDPVLNSTDDGRFATSVTTPTASGLTIEGRCGLFDLINFGPGASQFFSGRSISFTTGVAEPGVLRLYGEATVMIDPTKYDVGVIGTTPYRARAYTGSRVSFADVFVPPPAAGAPNAGDATTLEVTMHLDCIESGSFGVNTGISVSAYTPAEYAADGGQYDSVTYVTDVVPGVLHAYCPFDFTGFPKVFNVTVGTPVVLRFDLGMSMDTQTTTVQVPGGTLFSNALNTATMIVTSADDVPLTGQSGKVYSAPGPLPTVTTSSTVTTTSTAPPTTTTLAGCAGTCGDGAVDAACGETCDCPAPADAIQAAYGCDGAAIVPPQEGCMTCRGCRLVPARCAEAAPATTTTIAGATTTTTSVDGGTTTTTLPAACAGTSGVAAAGCIIDTFLAEPLCPDAPPPSKIEGGFRKKLGTVRATLGRAVAATGKKRSRLVRGATKKLTGIGKRAAKLGGKKLSPACAERVGDLVDRATSLIEQAP
jgi:hypothetical protein